MMRSIAILACFAATGAAAAVPRAEKAWQAGDYMGAFALAAEAAENGDSDAQFLLAEAYRQGKGTYTNVLAAEVWYFRAAQQGHVIAAAELGAIYAGEHRTEEARHWLRFAADKGDIGAQGSLAALLFNAPQNDQEQAEALALMSRAASRGSAEARVQLARMQAARGIVPAQEQAAVTPPAPTPVAIAAATPVPPKPAIASAPPTLLAAAAPLPTHVAAPAIAPVRLVPAVKAFTPTPMVLTLAAAAPLSMPAASPAAQEPAKPLLASITPLRATRAHRFSYASYVPRRKLAAQPLGYGWRVQVGAFRSSVAAQKARNQLSLRVTSLRAENLLISRMGTLLRVQTGAGSRARAVALCRTIRDAHWPCFLSGPRSLRAGTVAMTFSDDVPAGNRDA